jgi:hypothetical protein
MEVLKDANLGLRFVLELCLLAAFGYWGFQVGQGIPSKVLLGIGVPIVVAALWGVFLAPASSSRMGELPRLGLEVVLFSLAVACLSTAGRPNLAVLLAALLTLNRVMLYLWRQ